MELSANMYGHNVTNEHLKLLYMYMGPIVRFEKERERGGDGWMEGQGGRESEF